MDFILGNGEVAVEVKGSSRVHSRELSPMLAFMDEYAPRSAYVVCNESAARISKGITITPWREFLRDLWDGKIIA